MKNYNLLNFYNSVYENALYLEPEFSLPNYTTLNKLIIESLPEEYLGTNFIVDSNGMALPVKETNDFTELFKVYKTSYYDDDNKQFVNFPLTEVW